MKKILSTIALALSLVLATPAVLPQTAVVAQAEAKVEYSEEYFWRSGIGINATTQIKVSGVPSKAKITYSSNKKSVATVSSKGVVKGVSLGKAKITVKQTYKGKTKKLDTLTFQVRNAKTAYGVWGSDWDRDFCVGAQPGWISTQNPADVSEFDDLIFFKNPKAKYTFYTDSKDLVMDENGKVTEVKNSGEAEITIKETYENKTREVGTFPLILKEPEYYGKDPLQICQGQTDNVYNYLDECGKAALFWDDKEFTDEEAIQAANSNSLTSDDVLEFVTNEDGNWVGEIKGKNPGIRYAALVQYNYLTQEYDNVFARFQIEVVDPSKANRIEFPWDDYKEENHSYVLRFDGDEEYDYDEVYVVLDNEYYSGPYQVTSSDPNVVTAKMDDGDILLKRISGGTATVTLKVNGAERSFKVKVDKFDPDLWDW